MATVWVKTGQASIKMPEDSALRIIAAEVALAFIAGVICGSSGVVNWLLAHQELAGWAQAAGSVLAIAAAFFIARGDQRAVDDRYAKQEQARLAAAYFAAAEATGVVGALHALLRDVKGPSNNFAMGPASPEFDSALQSLNAVPTHELEHPIVVGQLKFVRMYLQRTRSDLVHIRTAIAKTGPLTDEALAIIADYGAKMSQCTKVIGDLLPPDLRPPEESYSIDVTATEDEGN